MEPKAPYGKNSIWTIEVPCPNFTPGTPTAQPKKPLSDPSYAREEYDLCFIEVEESGEFKEPDQLEEAEKRIHDARKKTSQGAIVVLFIHGWHNNCEWHNENLVSFRGLLQALMLREMERHGRRVIGVYVGWNGDPKGPIRKWLARIPVLTHTSFHDRYGIAGALGKSDALTDSVVRITKATKSPLNGVFSISPLILAGHSMGAFILQSSVLALIENRNLDMPMDYPPVDTANVTMNGQDVHMPDLILSLNSAAESAVAEQIIELFNRQAWSKVIDHGSINYHPPMLISVTSKGDKSTSWAWEAVKRGQTDGHNPALATHEFVPSPDTSPCKPIPGLPDFGQAWHCIEGPLPPFGPSPSFLFKLPTKWPKNGVFEHASYELKAKDPMQPKPFWIFRVPKTLIKDHGDIFNFQAASLTLALIQISGALVSGATDWQDTFSTPE